MSSTKPGDWPESTWRAFSATSTSALLDDGGVGVGPGDWVLIHVGFAMSKIDEDEAHETRRMLEGMGEDYERELENLKAGVIE